MVAVVFHSPSGDRYFVTVRERSKKYHGSGVIWFRPEVDATAPYQASMTVALRTGHGIYESVCRSCQFFSDWKAAEDWAVAEYQRLRQTVGGR